MTRRITDCVATAARRQPNDHAVIDVRDSTVCIWSWGKLWREAERVAGLLLKLGVSVGDIVAYQLPNRAEFIAITLGILRVGAVCCPLTPLLRERYMLAVLSRSGVRVLFVPDQFQDRRYPMEVAAMEHRLVGLERVIVVRTGESKAAALPQTVRPIWVKLDRTVSSQPDQEVLESRRPQSDAIAQLLFTRDASGALNGVLHRHDALMKAAAMHAVRLGPEGTDRIFVPSLLAEQTGFLYGMWLALSLGVAQIVQGTWDPAKALRMMRDYRGTFLQAAPIYLADIVAAAQSGAKVPPCLRLVVPTGVGVPWRQLMDARVCGGFGTAEGCLATLAGPKDPPGTEGRALPEVRLRICDDLGEVLPTGQQGHLQTQSPTMFAGYLDDSALTSKAYTADGWYRTGSFASIDEEGYLRVTSRIARAVANGDHLLDQ